jgi:hypothetical protein
MDCSDAELKLILNGLGLRAFNVNITERKATEYVDKIGKDCAQFSTFDYQREMMDETTKIKESTNKFFLKSLIASSARFPP